jgi:TetR/AcrR family transcriptional regulator, mexJK operon transcriptional repressor
MPKDSNITVTRPVIDPVTKKAARPKAKPHSGGRPSRAAAALLGDKIIDVATDLFLREGYGSVSLERIARDARVSKRTLYQRFTDKAGLFKAVVHRIVEQLRPKNDARFFEGGDLKTILLRLAKVILDASLTPDALALHRVIVAEATRFPDLAAAVSKESLGPEAIRRIAALLESEAVAGRLAVKNATFVATQFLFMIIALPQRRAMGAGPSMTAAERGAWIQNSVDLLLDGCRPR